MTGRTCRIAQTGLQGQSALGGPSFSCLWLVLWSKAKAKIQTTRNSCKKQRKRPLFKRKEGVLWSCYPDLNRRPHPYQCRKTLYFRQNTVFLWLFCAHFFTMFLCAKIYATTPMPKTLCPAGHESDGISHGDHAHISQQTHSGDIPWSIPTIGPALYQSQTMFQMSRPWRATQPPTPIQSTLNNKQGPPFLGGLSLW